MISAFSEFADTGNVDGKASSLTVEGEGLSSARIGIISGFIAIVMLECNTMTKMQRDSLTGLKGVAKLASRMIKKALGRGLAKAIAVVLD